MINRYSYDVEVRSYLNEQLQLYFPNQHESPHGDGSPIDGIIVLEALLKANYPKLNFKFEEKNIGGYEVTHFRNILTVTGAIECLCATHQLCIAPSVFSKRNGIGNSWDYEAIRNGLVERIRKGILDESILQDQAAIVKPIIRVRDHERYELFKRDINTFFDNLKLALPSILTTTIANIDRLNDLELEFYVPKDNILMGKICQQRSKLEADPDINKQVFQKIIQVYDAMLKSRSLKTAEERDNYLKEYEKYEQQVEAALHNAASMQNQSVTQPMKASINPLIENLKDKIQAMTRYGEGLKNNGINKGQIACDIAGNIKAMAEEFFNQDDKKIVDGFEQFKTNFLSELDRKKEAMGHYRVSWETIGINIAIALTGIGALIIAGNLIYSKRKYDRPLFLFSKPRTTCEERIDAVKESLNLIQIRNN